MTPVLVDTTYRITVVCLSTDQIGLNTQPFRITSTSVAPTVYDSEVAAYFSTTFAPLYAALLSVECSFLGIKVTRTTGALPFERPVTDKHLPAVGTVAGAALPAQTSGIISLYTVLVGKQYAGRVYVPFPGGNDNDVGQTPSNAYRAGLAALAGVYTNQQTINGTVGTVTGSFGRMYAPPGGPDQWYRFTAYTAHQIWATQRRRGSYGRKNPAPF